MVIVVVVVVVVVVVIVTARWLKGQNGKRPKGTGQPSCGRSAN